MTQWEQGQLLCWEQLAVQKESRIVPHTALPAEDPSAQTAGAEATISSQPTNRLKQGKAHSLLANQPIFPVLFLLLSPVLGI